MKHRLAFQKNFFFFVKGVSPPPREFFVSRFQELVKHEKLCTMCR